MLGATIKGQQFAGGVIPVQEWYAPSLTANREAGLGQWDVGDIVALLHTGVSKRSAVFGPMAQVVYDSLQHLTESDVQAIALYLKSLAQNDAPRVPVQVRPTEGQAKSAFAAGRKIYDAHCKSCHREDGGGMPPAYPPLVNNQAINMDFAVNAIRMVLFGGFPPGTERNARPFGMPPFAYSLSDQDVAAVVTYMRQAWGNTGGPISAAQVAKYRTFPSD
jgi:mono/diheme cytochrome c family protein